MFHSHGGTPKWLDGMIHGKSHQESDDHFGYHHDLGNLHVTFRTTRIFLKFEVKWKWVSTDTSLFMGAKQLFLIFLVGSITKFAARSTVFNRERYMDFKKGIDKSETAGDRTLVDGDSGGVTRESGGEQAEEPLEWRIYGGFLK